MKLAIIIVAATLSIFSHGFSTKKSFLQHSSPTTSSTTTTRLFQQQQPNFGDWTNDDYLNNLSGTTNDDYYSNENYEEQEVSENYTTQQQQQAAAPQNQLTDEEITAWALNSASFYNTDVSIEEAYGVKRDGPPRREEGTEVDGW